MASASKEIAVDVQHIFRLYTDATIERFYPWGFHPASDDPTSAVQSKDVTIDSNTGLSVRIIATRLQDPPWRLPVVVYIHGGGFCLGSATEPVFHNFVSSVVKRANVLALSIDYRLAPECPLPTAFDDSWGAFKWIAAHAASGGGPDPWLNECTDFERVYIGGESAGATIANYVAVRAGAERSFGVDIAGVFLMNPFFGGKEVDKLYKVLCPESSGQDDDPRLFPAVDPRIREMAGRRVIFILAEKDQLRDGAWCHGLKIHENRSYDLAQEFALKLCVAPVFTSAFVLIPFTTASTNNKLLFDTSFAGSPFNALRSWIVLIDPSSPRSTSFS